jgi:hypothetical protein
MTLDALVAIKREHLCEGELLRFLRGRLDRAECRRVVRHLLTDCRVCQAIGRRLWALGDQPLIPVPGWPARRAQ